MTLGVPGSAEQMGQAALVWRQASEGYHGAAATLASTCKSAWEGLAAQAYRTAATAAKEYLDDLGDLVLAGAKVIED